MTWAEKMELLFRLTFLAVVLASEVCTQQSTSSDFIASSCRRSLMQLDLPAQNVLWKYVRFSAIDQAGKAHLITDALATQCGYTIAYDDWGNILFTASLYSCYTRIGNDTYYTVSVKIEISSAQNMGGAASYMKVVHCSYVWSPREIVCEKNYMEVSVRRKIPLIAEGAFKDEPEDWSTAFTQAVSGYMSVWQVVFHLSATQKATMLIDEAQGIGYGINTTEARILLRSPYNSLQAVPQKIGGVTFSTVKATLFYKQRWFIYLVDNAVACPVDDVQFVGGMIVWTVPKNISPLLTGANSIQSSRIEFGVDLLNLSNAQILSRNYVVVDSSTVTTAQIPVGAVGGYFKSHVVNSQYGVTYHIRPFLENVWTDNAWGVTKYTIIKDITTPFQPQLPVLTNETVPSTLIFNVTVGTFLPDVRLVNLTVGGTTLTVPHAVDLGYVVENKTYPNGSVIFVVKVPFGDQHVVIQSLPDGILFILNITFGFKIIPYEETFTVSGIIEYFMPQPNVGPCHQNGGTLTTTLGNLDPSWSIYIKDVLVTLSSGLLASTNGTQSTVQVPAASNLVTDEVTSGGLTSTIPISIKDQNGNTLHTILISCDAPPNPAVCLPDGTMQVAVQKISNIPNMDMSKLTLRNASCGPVSFDNSTAKFSFTVDSCLTTRMFRNNLMIYNNEIFYNSPVTGKPLYIMNVTCNYTTNSTLVVNYGYVDDPTPSAQTGIAPIELVLRLSIDDGYDAFYNDTDYPVVKYLRDALYFEVELLYSTDPQLELFLDSCWATTTPDMSSPPTWPIIDNSCEHNEPYLTIFLPVTANARVQFPSHLKRFEVKTFTFMDGDSPYAGEIYFHCDAIICDSTNLASDPTCTQIGPCIPARQRIGRSVDADDKHRLVSSRAVFLLASKIRADKQIQNPPQ